MDNYRSIKKVLYVLFIANIAVTAAKILLGLVTNSTALSADGFHSLADSANNVIGIIGITLAGRPKDLEHPYGYKKVETMASLIISAALGGIYAVLLVFLPEDGIVFFDGILLSVCVVDHLTVQDKSEVKKVQNLIIKVMAGFACDI